LFPEDGTAERLSAGLDDARSVCVSNHLPHELPDMNDPELPRHVVHDAERLEQIVMLEFGAGGESDGPTSSTSSAGRASYPVHAYAAAAVGDRLVDGGSSTGRPSDGPGVPG